MPAPKCCFDHILPRDLLRPHAMAKKTSTVSLLLRMVPM